MRLRPLPSTLPTGVGRLASLAAATAVAGVAAGVVGALNQFSLAAWIAFVSSTVLLLTLIAGGLRLRAILTTSILAVAVEAAATAVGYAEYGWLVLPIGFLAFTLWSVPGVLAFGGGLLMGTASVLAAVAWPLAAILGVWLVVVQPAVRTLLLGGRGPGVETIVLCAAAPVLLAWLGSALGRRAALKTGVLLAAMRDGCVRTFALAAACAAALWAGDASERGVARASVGTPLESLAPTAGWAVAALVLVAVAWTAWRLPRLLVVGQLRGQFEARAVGEVLLLVWLYCLVPVVIWRLDADVSLGRACIVALAGATAYAWVRLRFAAPAPIVNAPLWLLVDSGGVAAVRRAAPRAAASWRAGQVTVLAAPEDARYIGGEHLRAAGLAGEIESLLPLRPVHLEDWAAAQPDAWKAMPVRELYAPPELWALILGAHAEPSARVLLLRQAPSDERPAPLLVRLRRRLRRETVLGVLLPRSNAATVRPGTPLEQLERLAAEAVSGEARMLERLRALQPPVPPPSYRRVMVFCAPGEMVAAERVARLIHGQRDAADRTVECWVAARDPVPSSWRKLIRIPATSFRLSASILARLLEGAASRGAMVRHCARLAMALLGRDGAFELDVVVWEGVDGPGGLPAPLIGRGVERGAVNRLIAIRPIGTAAPERVPFSPALYAGEIRVGRGDSTDVVADAVARKLLMLDLAPMAQATASAAPDLSSAPGGQLPEEEMIRAAPDPPTARPNFWRATEDVKAWYLWQMSGAHDVRGAIRRRLDEMSEPEAAEYLEHLRAMEAAAQRLVLAGPEEGQTPNTWEFLLPTEFAPALARAHERERYLLAIRGLIDEARAGAGARAVEHASAAVSDNGVYIIHSRTESTGSAERLIVSLREALGPGAVLDAADAARVDLDAPAREQLHSRIRGARAVLVLVDRALVAGSGGDERVGQEGRFLVEEVELALSLSKPTIPVVVDGLTVSSAMSALESRAGLSGLTPHGAFRVDAESWDRDVSALVALLGGMDSAAGETGQPRARTVQDEEAPGAGRAGGESGAEAGAARTGARVIYVSCKVTEATAYVVRPLIDALRDRFRDLDVITTDSRGPQLFARAGVRADEAWQRRVEEAVERAVVTLVVIGHDWTASRSQEELELVLSRSARVVPVLLDGARMPASDELTPTLRPLTSLQAIPFDGRAGPAGLRALVARVEEAIGAV